MTLFLVEFTFLFSPCIKLYYANVSEIYFYLVTYHWIESTDALPKPV